MPVLSPCSFACFARLGTRWQPAPNVRLSLARRAQIRKLCPDRDLNVESMRKTSRAAVVELGPQ